MNIPIQLRLNSQIPSLVAELQSLRSSFALAMSQIDAGIYPADVALNDLPLRLITNLKNIIALIEAATIPNTQFSNFLAGTITLPDYADLDTLFFYNGLVKLKFTYTQLIAILLVNQSIKKQPITAGMSSTDFYTDILNESEFTSDNAGYENPVTEIEESYSYYIIVQGDTLPIISSKVYDGDFTKWGIIAEVNQITQNDLIDDNLIGKIIRYPDQSNGNTQIEENLVYEQPPINYDKKAVEKFLYGSDLFLIDKKIVIDGNQDIGKISGIDCLIANLQDRFNITQGGLNPLQSSVGVNSIEDTKPVPFVVQLDRLLTEYESQAKLDPRVISATINRRTLSVIGDAIKAEMQIVPIGGESTAFTVTIPSQ